MMNEEGDSILSRTNSDLKVIMSYSKLLSKFPIQEILVTTEYKITRTKQTPDPRTAQTVRS